jgi:glutamine cyclotransferase
VTVWYTRVVAKGLRSTTGLWIPPLRSALRLAALVSLAMQWPADARVPQSDRMGAPTIGYQLVACYPHDEKAFTQGLLFRDGVLYESTGLNGESTLRRVRLETGAVLEQRRLNRRYFAEGLAEHAGELFQLTWDSGVAFVHDARTLDLRRTLRYRGEGWGLTSDGMRLVMSDGSDTLRFLDPTTFAVTGRVRVTDAGTPVERLNELEFINGAILANVWLTDRIAVIDPTSGTVTAWLDLADLVPVRSGPTNAVLNGIAWDGQANRLFVTGKLWPRLYEILVLWEDMRTFRPRGSSPLRPERGCE